MSSKQYYVYIMTNPSQSTLYTGITNDLKRRVYEHKEKVKDGFTKQYNVVRLVYYEQFDGPTAAIKREKQIKGGSRKPEVTIKRKV